MGLAHTACSSGPRGRPLQRQGRHLLGDVLDLHVQSARVRHQPAQVRMRRRPAIRLLGHPRHRAVVDDGAVLVAPRRVPDLADRQLRGVAGDDAVHEPRGAGAVQPVLEERRDVDQRARVADGVVLVVVVRLVGADRVVARPVAKAEAFGERRRPFMKGRAHRHVGIIGILAPDAFPLPARPADRHDRGAHRERHPGDAGVCQRAGEPDRGRAAGRGSGAQPARRGRRRSRAILTAATAGADGGVVPGTAGAAGDGHRHRARLPERLSRTARSRRRADRARRARTGGGAQRYLRAAHAAGRRADLAGAACRRPARARLRHHRRAHPSRGGVRRRIRRHRVRRRARRLAHRRSVGQLASRRGGRRPRRGLARQRRGQFAAAHAPGVAAAAPMCPPISTPALAS